MKQHKVTVTGDVDAETLIRTLLKSGQHAELWPDKKHAISKPSKGASGAISDASDNRSDDDEGDCDGKKPHVQNVVAQPTIRKDNDFAKDVPAIAAVNLVPLVVDKLTTPDGGHPMEKPPTAAQGGGPAAGAKNRKKKKKKNSSATFAAAAGSTIDGKPAGQAGFGTPPVVHVPHVCSSPASTVAVLPAVYEYPARYSSESYHIFSDENANDCSVM